MDNLKLWVVEYKYDKGWQPDPNAFTIKSAAIEAARIYRDEDEPLMKDKMPQYRVVKYIPECYNP